MAAPQLVLSEQLSEALANRIVRTAVFTTFNFDPAFFELHVLPVLFPNQKFSEVEKVRLIQLEDCLRSVRDLVVYFDANALAHDGDTPKLGYDRIDVHWQRGVFHPKTIFLLAEDRANEGNEILIACCLSANITRAGWWENVEAAHIEIVEDKRISQRPCSFRNDLMAFLNRIRRSIPYEAHDALDKIHQFIRHRTETTLLDKSRLNKEREPRLFGGSPKFDFANWLTEEAAIPDDWNLEVVSPYFDKSNAIALVRIVNATQPRRTRVYLPQAEDGTALVSDEVYRHVESMPNVSWAKFPAGVTQSRGANSEEKLKPRFVHAKVYRFWRKRFGDLMVVGSINCTQPAHSKADSGNLEAGLLIDATDQNLGQQWWLNKLEAESITCLTESPDEADGNDRALFDVFLQYDWAEHRVAVRMAGKLQLPVAITDLTDKVLFSVDACKADEWQACDQSVADNVRDAIQASSFLNVQCGEVSWRVLIRECQFAHRPSLLSELTPDEILRYWSLLSLEQRAAFLEQHLAKAEPVEGLSTTSRPLVDTTESIFNRFSGIFHAFGHLRRHLLECLEQERFTEAEYRLLGAKYDSLPELLRKMLAQDDADPLLVYITFLNAKQLRLKLAKAYEPFLNMRSASVAKLDRLIDEGLNFRNAIDLGETAEKEQFLTWYEAAFLTEVGA